MKSCIENELKRNKIPPKIIRQPRTYILASDRYTSKPTGHSVARLQSTDISCTMLAYIYRARVRHALSRAAYTELCIDIVKMRSAAWLHWSMVGCQSPGQTLTSQAQFSFSFCACHCHCASTACLLTSHSRDAGFKSVIDVY